MLVARDISVRLGGQPVLDGIDLRVGPGEIVVLVGPNGAGKSTALKVLSGEIRAMSGSVELEGSPLADIPASALARARAVLPQIAALAFPFTVLEIVRLGAEAGGGRGRMVDELCLAALARTGMAEHAGRLMQTLSGGEAQRVHLARTLAQADVARQGGGAFYLLLDEPTASLDLEHQLLTLKIARDFATSGGGVLAVLHDLNLAAMAADRLVAMKAGRIVAQGAPADVLTDELVSRLYNVHLLVGQIPSPPAPFVLPQTASRQADRTRRIAVNGSAKANLR